MRAEAAVSIGSENLLLSRLEVPEAFVCNEADFAPINAGYEWRLGHHAVVDPADMRHDMHVNIVTLQAGAVIPFAETHVMEHGLYVLEGKGVYRLNRLGGREAGDFLWLRAFCPQACYAKIIASVFAL